MGITSASSIDDIAREYITCASYDLSSGSIAMAERFVVACRALQLRRPKSATVDNNPVAFDYQAVANQLDRALAWIGANRSRVNGGTSTQIYDMSGVRSRW